MKKRKFFQRSHPRVEAFALIVFSVGISGIIGSFLYSKKTHKIQTKAAQEKLLVQNQLLSQKLSHELKNSQDELIQLGLKLFENESLGIEDKTENWLWIQAEQKKWRSSKKVKSIPIDELEEGTQFLGEGVFVSKIKLNVVIDEKRESVVVSGALSSKKIQEKLKKSVSFPYNFILKAKGKTLGKDSSSFLKANTLSLKTLHALQKEKTPSQNILSVKTEINHLSLNPLLLINFVNSKALPYKEYATQAQHAGYLGILLLFMSLISWIYSKILPPRERNRVKKALAPQAFSAVTNLKDNFRPAPIQQECADLETPLSLKEWSTLSTNSIQHLERLEKEIKELHQSLNTFKGNAPALNILRKLSLSQRALKDYKNQLKFFQKTEQALYKKNRDLEYWFWDLMSHKAPLIRSQGVSIKAHFPSDGKLVTVFEPLFSSKIEEIILAHQGTQSTLFFQLEWLKGLDRSSRAQLKISLPKAWNDVLKKDKSSSEDVLTKVHALNCINCLENSRLEVKKDMLGTSTMLLINIPVHRNRASSENKLCSDIKLKVRELGYLNPFEKNIDGP